MHRVPAVAGVISAGQVTQTAASIAQVQSADGAIAWFQGGHLDPWDHVQAAMGLAAAGWRDEAERAYRWLARAQRADGSWALRYENGNIADPGTDANFCAYLATGLWHHWLLFQDRGVLEELWPVLDAAMECVQSMRLDSGAVAWARDENGRLAGETLVTANASVGFSLRCAAAIADLLGHRRPEWQRGADTIAYLLRRRETDFEAKPRHSMDWYYPVLCGQLVGQPAVDRIDARWSEFVVTGWGIRCVTVNTWVTGAESCELALALESMGRHSQALQVFADMQHLRDSDGAYWTGLDYEAGRRWPVELSTWTSGTVILAADALSRTTPASGLFRGEGLVSLSGHRKENAWL